MVRIAADTITYQSLGFLDVSMSEEKLAVEVGEIDGVQVDDMNVAEACRDEIFQ